METLQETARVATSKPVQRVVVNTVLLISTGLTLLCLAAVASALFFQNFVPHQVTTTPVHLQYGSALNPYGITSLTKAPMKSQQDYDVSVRLSMPRSPANVERGNFMVSLCLLDKDVMQNLAAKARNFADEHIDFGDHTIVFQSRRPALVPYIDPIVSLASRVFFLFYHMFVHSSQTISMTIPLAERVLFSKGVGVPASAYVEVEAGQDIQIYSAELIVTAQLRGLRWLMFHYRLPMYFTFTFLFWTCELLFMGVAWSLWGSLVFGEPADANGKPQAVEGQRRRAIGAEQDYDGSDHPRQTPPYGRQPRSQLKQEPEVKSETEQERQLSEVPLAGGEADDEKEEEEDFDSDDPQRDIGAGTSFSAEGRESIRRRPSRNLGD